MARYVKLNDGLLGIHAIYDLYFYITYQIFLFRHETYNGITVASKFAGPVGQPSLKYKGPQAILWAIGPRARLILTPVHSTQKQNKMDEINMNVWGNIFIHTIYIHF